MEKKKTNIIFGKSDEKATSDSYTCKLFFPEAWADRIGLTPESREADIYFDDDRIIVTNPSCSYRKRTPLASNNRIHTFSMIWKHLYKNFASTPLVFFEDIQFVGNGLSELGFVMDCGESMKRLLPDCKFAEPDILKTIINQVNDIQILGNAIYSQWRYWNHWSCVPMEEKDYEWFVTAFSRLAELTDL